MIEKNNLIDDSILEDWLSNMFKDHHEFLEPLLDKNVSAILYKTCKSLQQDHYVFIMAVDIFERYLQAMKFKEEQVESPTLKMVAAIWAASKLSGLRTLLSLNANDLVTILNELTGLTWTVKKVVQAEIEIYNTLQCKLPNFSLLDDVDVVMEVFMKKWHLKANLHPLSIELTTHLYLNRIAWFKNLKKTFNQNEDSLKIFKMLTSKRIYLPIGVLISSLFLVGYDKRLEFNTLLLELADSFNIHTDHLNALAKQIVQVYSMH